VKRPRKRSAGAAHRSASSLVSTLPPAPKLGSWFARRGANCAPRDALRVSAQARKSAEGRLAMRCRLRVPK
jgi:hypothetical protein